MANETHILPRKSPVPLAPAFHKLTLASGTVVRGVPKFRRRHILLLCKALIVFDIAVGAAVLIFSAAIWFL
jgi:hypothetical protein